jgi:NAD(P)-dependent dehydrogenase (short-subunit alcohol dehydrogenase family)
MTQRDLTGRVAIVTGAGRGLGRAMARALVRAGTAVVFADIDEQAATEAAKDGGGRGQAIAVRCDITQQADCARAVAAAQAFGGLHILVNNAALGPAHLEAAPNTRSLKFWEADAEVWQHTIVTNVNGTFLMSHVAAPAMIAGGWGRIVNITTSLDTMQRKMNSPYGVSKTAIEAETLIWAQDLAGSGVTVNSLIPGGAADTDFVSPRSRAAMLAAGRKLIDPQIMVAPLLWLASADSDGITGARFVAKLWDNTLPPSEAAKKAREASVLRAPLKG